MHEGSKFELLFVKTTGKYFSHSSYPYASATTATAHYLCHCVCLKSHDCLSAELGPLGVAPSFQAQSNCKAKTKPDRLSRRLSPAKPFAPPTLDNPSFPTRDSPLQVFCRDL